MMLPLPEPPRSVCILRLSAIGDACHVVPIVRTLQQAWPATQLTWIIGRSEARLMTLLEGVEFITVDKRASLAGLGALRSVLAGRHFEVLLHMQLALRASLVAASVSAAVKLGFDRPRARELQWLFTNARIAARTREHVLDSFFGLLARARVLLSPDSGPAHMATTVGTPVIGLYAATNPARSGPYLSRRWCVDAYRQAARTFRGCEPDQLPWTHKIEEPGVMDLVQVDEVTGKLDELLGSQP